MENETINQQSNYSIVRTYAGFWWRFLALIIDSIIIGIVQSIFIMPLLGFLGLSLASFPESGSMDQESIPYLIAMAGSMSMLYIVSFGIGWLYYAFLESSKYQGTHGKIMLNIKVTDMEGNQIGFGRATGRFFGKIISAMIFYIGFIMAGFTSRKQALHDIMAGCLVVKEEEILKG
jgi:uncharacterized RDD family membrane protein YckC